MESQVEDLEGIVAVLKRGKEVKKMRPEVDDTDKKAKQAVSHLWTKKPSLDQVSV